jgi:hypothetical protein
MLGVGKQTRVAFLFALATGVAACKADTPPLTDGSGGIDPDCTPYADLLVSFTPADGSTSDDGPNALGEPDEAYVTVATNDVLTVGFIGLGAVEDGEDVGDDIRVAATAVEGTEVAINLSTDGETWETAGTLIGDDTGIDIADTASLSLVVYVQLEGVTGALAVDAFESLQTVCTTSVR